MVSRRRSLRIRERWHPGKVLSGLAWLAGLMPFVPAVADGPAAGIVQPSDTHGVDTLAAAESLMAQFFAASDRVGDYRMVMDKQQRAEGELQPPERLEVEHRRTPDCRYMRWIGERNHGREMIYCSDRYDGMIQVHNGGLWNLLSVSLDPNGSMATKGQLHRIYESGLFAMTAMVRKDNDFLEQHRELPPPTLSHRDVDGSPSTCVELQRGADMFNAYHLGRQSLCLDDSLSLPTELSLWNADGELMEHYVYSHYELNTGLTDADFDVKNRHYHF